MSGLPIVFAAEVLPEEFRQVLSPVGLPLGSSGLIVEFLYFGRLLYKVSIGLLHFGDINILLESLLDDLTG